MNEDSSPLNPRQDGPLMDFFLAVARAWKLLVIVPVVVGILVGAAMHLGGPMRSSEVYRSQATIYSEGIADPELALSELMGRTDSAVKSGQGEVGPAAGLDVNSSLKIARLGNSLYQITLDQPAPSSAQASLKAALVQARARLIEGDEKRLAEGEEVLKAMNAGLARQQSLYDLGLRLLSDDSTAVGKAESGLVPLWKEVVELADRIEERQAAIARAQENLARYRTTEVVVEPTPDSALPNPQISSTRLGILAALVTGLVLLLVVVIRHRFQRLFQEPAMRNMLQRVLAEL